MNITTLNIYNAEFLVLVLQNNGCKTKDPCSNIINLRTFQDLQLIVYFLPSYCFPERRNYFKIVLFGCNSAVSRSKISNSMKNIKYETITVHSAINN